MAETKDSISYALGLLGQVLREVEQVELVKEAEGFDVASNPAGIEACVVAMRGIREAQSALRALRQLRETRDLVNAFGAKP